MILRDHKYSCGGTALYRVSRAPADPAALQAGGPCKRTVFSPLHTGYRALQNRISSFCNRTYWTFSCSQLTIKLLTRPLQFFGLFPVLAQISIRLARWPIVNLPGYYLMASIFDSVSFQIISAAQAQFAIVHTLLPAVTQSGARHM
jgi:hypothetical protein